MSSSIGEGSPTVAVHSSSTYTWQVAQAQAPPHSASMPGTALRMAFSITVEPFSASTSKRVPSNAMKVIFAMHKPCQYRG